MFEVWLRPNRRILAVGALLPTVALVAGATLWILAAGAANRLGLQIVGGLLAGIGLTGLAFMLWQVRQSRLACDGRHLLVNLGTARAIRVPLEVVEGFLLGQGPSFLPGQRNEQAEVVNVVVRLAERASEWERVDVNRQLGSWCKHYITIRGTWCERLNVAVVNRLNVRLSEVKQMLKEGGPR
jgi:hypothetical protein